MSQKSNRISNIKYQYLKRLRKPVSQNWSKTERERETVRDRKGERERETKKKRIQEKKR